MGDLEATYDGHLRLIGKRVRDFLLMFIELFSLGITAEALRAIIGSKSAISLKRDPVDPKFKVEEVAPTNHSSSQKTRLNGLSHGIKIRTDFSFVLSQSTRLTDRETDRILIARPRLHSMSRGTNVAIAIHCSLRGSTSRQSYWALITRPTMHQPTNSTIISATDEHLSLFWRNLYCTCAETAISGVHR